MRNLKFMVFGGALAVFLLGNVVAGEIGGNIPISTKSSDAKASYLQGRDLQERLRGNEALAYFKKAIAADENFALAHFGYALNAPSAKAFFAHMNKAVSLSAQASDGEQLWIKGFQAGVDGRPAKQRELFTELAQKYAHDERAHNVLGGFYFGQQEWPEAIKEYEKAIAINPEFSQPYNQLGYAYRFLGKYDDAAAAFQKYIKVLPNDPNPYDSYAELLLKMGKYDESIENYRKALAINEKFVASHRGIATCYNLKGESAKARKQLDLMYENAQNDGQRRGALFARTVSYVFEGDLENALKSEKQRYHLAKKIDDAAAMSGDLLAMGNILVAFGEPDKALKKYDASIKTMRESGSSDRQKQLAEQFQHVNLFNVAESRGDVAAARREAEAFAEIALASNNPAQIRGTHGLRGRLAMMQKDFGAAVAELRQDNMQNPYTLFRLGLAYQGKGETEKAEKWIARATQFNALNNLNQAFVAQRAHKMMSMK